VTDFDEQQHRAAYEAMAKGDLQPIGALMHADHVHHMVSMGISARGRERTLELVSRMFDRLQVSDYRVSQVTQHGEFVVTCISGRSALRPDEFHGVDVVRVGPDGLAVEAGRTDRSCRTASTPGSSWTGRTEPEQDRQASDRADPAPRRPGTRRCAR
jgi:hypothetical protein